MFTLAGNFYSWVKKKQEKSVTIIVLGLDNAGKTTLLYGLKDELPQADVTPTIGFRPSKLISGKYTIQWFDVGGAKNFRRVWQSYYPEVHGIIYVVDAAAPDRFEEAKETLDKTLESEGIPGKPVLIFANKQDLEGCISAHELSQKLGMLDRKDCCHHVANCQAKPKEGDHVDPRIGKALKWLLDAIEKDYRSLNDRVKKDMEEQKRKEKERKEAQRKRAEESKAARLREQAEKEAKEKEAKEKGVSIEMTSDSDKKTSNEDTAKETSKETEVDQVVNTEPIVEIRQSAILEKREEDRRRSDGIGSPAPNRLPALEVETSTIRTGNTLRLGDLKPMPPVVDSIHESPARKADLSLPNSVPSPQLYTNEGTH